MTHVRTKLQTRPQINTVGDILEKESVKELVQFERYCRDNALWEEMDRCYTADSQIIISWFHGTGHEFVEASKKMAGRAPHKIYNTQVWLHGDRAVAVMITTIQKRVELDGVLLELNSDAKLVFRLRKEDGMWFIAGMEGVYEKDSLTPVVPAGGFTLPKQALTEFRESYGCLAWVLSRSGYEIDGELPGIDRPDLVDAFFKKTEEWLNQDSIQ